MEQWWNRNNSNVSRPIKAKIEDITGRIPLFLRPFLGVTDENFQEKWDDGFQTAKDILDIDVNLNNFTKAKLKEGMMAA
jgi:hypothetical protein